MVGTLRKPKENGHDDLEQHSENNEHVSPADENLDEPHAYIYIADKNKRPCEGERRTVAASYIKKFDYEKYTGDPKPDLIVRFCMLPVCCT